MLARKNKTEKKPRAVGKSHNNSKTKYERRNLEASDQKMDKGEDWVKSLTEKLFRGFIPKSRDHT